MHRWTRTVVAALAIAALVAAPVAFAEDRSERIEELKRRLEALERIVKAGGEHERQASEEANLEEIERKIDVLVREIEALKLGEAAPEASVGEHGLGPAASKVYAVDRGVSIGGYGEMLFESVDSRDESGAPSGRSDQLDFLRAIVYVGYKFNDRIVFNSEIEFEHASTGKDGEVSVEFAYLDFLLRDAFNVRAGMVLVPLGFVNELHEPPVFLGARRPYVEQALIPTTWRENGVGVFGEAGPVSYRAYVVSGLEGVAGTASGSSGFSASGIRGGRSSGSKSAAEDLAVTGRVDWRPAPGLAVGAGLYRGGADQGMTTPSGDSIDATVTLVEAHVEYRRRGLQVRGLFVDTDIDDVARLNAAQGLVGPQSIGERQVGWYGEIGYDVLTERETRQALVPYLRYERYDTQETVPGGFTSDPATDVTVTTVGVAWKPIDNVVVKADYNRIENEARSGVDQINAALGFLF